MLLLGALPVGHAKADTASGVDYRELRATAGSLNTGTSVSIATSLGGGEGNYVVNPITTTSTLKGTPSSTVPSGYGWKTAGFLGQSVPAGTWSFDVETQTTGVTAGTGEAYVHIYAYATNILGSNVTPIGTATSGTDLLTLLGGTVPETLTFSASAIDMTGRVLVVEYWIIVPAAPLLAATVTFHTGSSVASVEVPTSSPTTFHLLPASVVAFGDSFTVSDSTGRMLQALRSPAETIAAADSVNFRVTRSMAETVAVTEQMRTRVSRSMEESVGVADDPATNLAPDSASAIAINDSAVRTLLALRSAPDSVAFADSITTAVTRSVAETLAASDGLSGKVTGRAISDAVAVADYTSTNIAPSISDAITVADSISKAASYPLVDSFAATDSIAAKVILRAVSDPLSAGDVISTSVSRTLLESITLADSAQRTYHASRAAVDSTAVADAISANTSTNRSISDAVSVADSAGRTYSTLAQAGDGITVADSLSAVRSFVRQASESISIADQNSAGLDATRTMADAASISDAAGRALLSSRLMSETQTVEDIAIAGGASFARSIADSILTAEAPGRAYLAVAQLADAVSVTDEIAQPPMLSEQFVVSDAVSIALSRNLQDSISMQELSASSPARTPDDSVAILDEITGVAVSWNRAFEESLALEDCTPFSCNQSLHLGESLSLADAFSPPPALQDTLSISDGIATNAGLSGAAADTTTVADGISITILPVPETPLSGSPLQPLGPQIVSDAALAGSLSAEPVSGQFAMPEGDLAQLASQLGLPSTEIDSVSSSDLSDMAVVLPTYHVTLSPSDELPGDDVLMTVMVAEIPAETQVIVPVDIALTPELTEHHDIPSMTLEFTPAVDASDFALAATILDSPPNGAPEPQGDLLPLYLDIRWAGTFGGAVDPSMEGFYSDQPTLTFALTEEWADESDVERDGNGVPEITLNLLNESTGEWEEIADIDFPIGATDDQYVYVAYLEHFSTYAVAASKDAGGSGGSAPTGARLSVQLVDSLVLLEQNSLQSRADSQFAVQLLDSVSVDSKPIAYWPLAAGENVSVLVTVTDIRPAGTFPPAANAIVLTEIANTGTEATSFVLEFWHGDARSTQAAVEIGPGETERVLVEVPFASPGEQALNVEARTGEGGLIAYRQITFEVPWLAIYFPLLITLLGGFAAAAGAGIYLFVRKFA